MKAAVRKQAIRCAIYTRKSSEEGLEQEFNSLDAQREACSSYIRSQRHEGWVEVKTAYDDGGFSGGNMERPGLKRLMEDVKSGQVDVIVVYKVDRLTRALSDFAKIVDVLDAMLAAPQTTIKELAATRGQCRHRLAKLLRLSWLSPDIVETIARGEHPPRLTPKRLLEAELPLAWSEQKAALGIG